MMEFRDWWKEFNEELAKLGLPQEGLRCAREHYDSGRAPEGAAKEQKKLFEKHKELGRERLWILGRYKTLEVRDENGSD